jgi:DNA-directed RNA polymerase specialized sigma24 family protein
MNDFFGDDVVRFRKSMVSVAVRKGFSGFEEDLAQEAILSALEKSEKFDTGRGTFSDFAYYVARSVAMDRIHRLRRCVSTPVRHKIEEPHQVCIDSPHAYKTQDEAQISLSCAMPQPDTGTFENELIAAIHTRICSTTRCTEDEASAVLEVWLDGGKEEVAERRGLDLAKLTQLVNATRRALRQDKTTKRLLCPQG